ncbi:MAG: TatD family hydrolase [Candidatus Thiodiazotropha sp. (ex Lucinoma aequizonata)]|nr:TatD family hydrolase [Candidatus Thiodiazotropha sp. (ex Lucinoma aequizonata)]
MLEEPSRAATVVQVVRPRPASTGARPIPTSEVPAKRLKKAKKPRKQCPCSVPGCDEATDYLKKHVIEAHVPQLFRESLDPSPEVCDSRHAALVVFSMVIVGSRGNPQGLVDLINTFGLIFPGATITGTQERATRELCKAADWPIPEEFTLYPLNSPALLLHWRALLAIATLLTERQRRDIRNSFPCPEPVNVVQAEEEVVSEEIVVTISCAEAREDLPSARRVEPEDDAWEPGSSHEEDPCVAPHAFDSHFHLDRTRRHLSLSPSATVIEIQDRVGPADPRYLVQVSGCTAVFCDPRTYPSTAEIRQLALSGVQVAVGVHPKWMPLSREDWDSFFMSFSSPHVVALGEIGLDYTCDPWKWPFQEAGLDHALQASRDRSQVVVFHCRDRPQAIQSGHAYLRALDIASRKLHHAQRIHVHCLQGPLFVVEAWIRQFSNVYFGFTGLVRHFQEVERDGLRRVPQDRLLLETDGPYFKPFGFAANAPHLLGYVAEEVSRVLGTTTAQVIDSSNRNATRLYVEGNEGLGHGYQMIPSFFPNFEPMGP